MKIHTFGISQTHNDEHYQFIDELIAVVTRLGAAALKIARLFGLLTAAHEREDAALRKIPGSVYTQKLHEAHEARKETVVGLFKANEALTHHFNPAVRDAGARIQHVLNAYKDTKRDSYIEETSAVYNLVQELNGETYAPSVQAAGLAAWVAELSRRNNAFETLMKASFDEKEHRCTEDIRAVRKEEDAIYRDICEVVGGAMKSDDVPEKGAEFITALNAVVARYRTALNRRLGHHHGHGHGSTSHDDGGTTPHDESGSDGSAGDGGGAA